MSNLYEKVHVFRDDMDVLGLPVFDPWAGRILFLLDNIINSAGSWKYSEQYAFISRKLSGLTLKDWSTIVEKRNEIFGDKKDKGANLTLK